MKKPNCIGVIEKRYNPIKYFLFRFMFWKYKKTNVNNGDALTFPAYDARYDLSTKNRKDTEG